MKASLIKLATVAGALTVIGLFTACGGGGGGHASGRPVILVYGGYWGYYSGVVFCDFGNNYCGTGLDYGITSGGLYYDGASAGTPTSGGTTSGGTTSGGTTSGGTTSGGTTSGGTTSGGTSAGTPTSGGTTSGGTTSSGATSSGQSVGQETTDVNLQRGLAANAVLDAKARVTATQFQMDFESARQLTQLADKMQILQGSGQLTDADRAAIARTALAVAGVEESEVSAAIAKAANGDKTAVNTVMTKAASNLGMPSTAMLRDQILPSLGINVP